jgi:hypothetical protein
VHDGYLSASGELVIVLFRRFPDANTGDFLEHLQQFGKNHLANFII